MARLIQADHAARMIWPSLAFERLKHWLSGVQIFGILGAHQRQVNRGQRIYQELI